MGGRWGHGVRAGGGGGGRCGLVGGRACEGEGVR